MIYDAFGTLLQQTGSAENDFRYTGEQFDATSGLYYLRARHYSPHSGRFTQRDTWEGNSQDPITLHKYVYGNSDPVTHIDPSGRFSLVEMGVTQTIRTELTSLQIDSGFSLLDRITDGQSQQITGPLAQANQALMLGVAAIGGVQMLKMLSRKFRTKCGGNSFDGETLVHTRDGLKPIKDVRIGDEVLAFNEQTGQEEYSPVVHLIRSDKEQGWVDITTAGGEVIRATAAHPFYAKSANDPSWQWMDAAKLLQGLELYTAANEADEVAGTRDYLAQRPAYNLTVDRAHTYFVGPKGVLVHNTGCGMQEGQRLYWGTWDDYPKLTANGKTYALIGNRMYSRHAVDRMQPSSLGTPAGGDGPGRSFPPNLIDEVIRNGSTRTVTVDGVQRTIHSSGTAEVVTEQGGRIVVTVNPFRGEP